VTTVNLLLNGFGDVLTPQNLIYALIGCLIGMLTGVLPGFGPAAATSLLLPLSFTLGATGSIIMMGAIYYGSMYGGTITSVLLNVPGEVSSVATCIDGYQMTKKGQAGKALSIAAVGSFVGGTIALIGMLFATRWAAYAVTLSAADLFALSFLSLFLVVGLAGKSLVKGAIAALLGLFIGLVGTDPVLGAPRFTMGSLQLSAGISFIAVVMGIFGLAEILESIGQRNMVNLSSNIGSTRLSMSEIRQNTGAMLRGTVIGFFYGLIPGSPAAACSFTSYAIEKRASKHPELFGKGAIQGVAGPETANNALGISNFIPLLALGIPSSATMAIILGAFTVNGITPGPLLFRDHADIGWAVIASFFVANVILVILALPLVRMWVSILRIPTLILYSITLGFMTIGAYTINNNVFDVAVMWISGIIGFIMRRLDVPLAPAALTLVLGPMLEGNLRSALTLDGNSFAGLLSGPVPSAAFGLAVLLILVKIGTTTRSRLTAEKPAEDVETRTPAGSAR
jgi:putative tricarboxylic transport membrane protein